MIKINIVLITLTIHMARLAVSMCVEASMCAHEVMALLGTVKDLHS